MPIPHPAHRVHGRARRVGSKAIGAFAGLLGLGTVGLMLLAAPTIRPVARAAPSAQRAPLCDARISRDARPRVIAEGEALTVTVRLDFDCRAETPAMALVVLVGGRDSEGLSAIRDTLADLAVLLPWEKGSVVGVIDVLNPKAVPLVLRGGDDGRALLAERATQLPAGGPLGVKADDHQWRRAIARAIPPLTESDPQLRPVAILINDGNFRDPLPRATPPPVDSLRGLLLALGGTAEAIAFLGNPVEFALCPRGLGAFDCRVLSHGIAQLPREVGQFIAERGGQRLTRWAYRDALYHQALTIVPGSRQPAEHMLPPEAAHALQLEQAISDVVGSRVIRYQARALEGEARSIGAVHPLSPDPLPDAFLYQGEVRMADLDVPNPRICIHRPGRRGEDCGAFEAALPATATARPSATATLAAPSVTPTPPSAPPSATMMPPRSRTLYLPRVLR